MNHPGGSGQSRCKGSRSSSSEVTHDAPSQACRPKQGRHPPTCREASGWPGCLAWRACYEATESEHIPLHKLGSGHSSHRIHLALPTPEPHHQYSASLAKCLAPLLDWEASGERFLSVGNVIKAEFWLSAE